MTGQGERSERVGGTWSQAQQKLEVFYAKIADLPEETMTFGVHAERWHQYRVKSKQCEKRTLAKEKNCITLLNLHFGKVEVGEITPRSIREAYMSMMDEENPITPSGKTLSGTYVRDAHFILRMIMDAAVEDGLASSNPCKDVTPPKRDTVEKQALTREQFQIVCSLLDEEGLTPLTISAFIAGFAGLRRSEICGLTWGDYDGTTLRVKHGVEQDSQLKGTKTPKGVRYIPAPEALRGVLDEWSKVQSSYLSKLGIERTESTRIVTNQDGQPMKPNNLDKRWREGRDYFGLERFTLHELRHTFLTHLVHSGADMKTAPDIAGHASAEVLLKIYSHSNRDREQAAMRGFEEYLFDNSEDSDVPFDVPAQKRKMAISPKM